MEAAAAPADGDIDDGTFARFQAGDEKAMERIVDMHWRRLLAFARLVVRPQDAAEDIVQETFVEAWRQRTRIRGSSGLRPWLFALVRRKASRHGSGVAIAFGDDPPEVPSPERATQGVLHGQMRRHLEEALGALSREDREIVTLKYFGGLKLREIAEVLGMPQGTVGVRVSRGLEKVREWFDSRGMALEDFLHD